MDSYAAVRANCHQKAAARVALRSTHERMAKTWQARLRGVTTGNFGTEAIPRTAPIKYLQSIINIMVQNEIPYARFVKGFEVGNEDTNEGKS